MSVWLVERDVGGYEYMLIDVFSTAEVAEEFCRAYNEFFNYSSSDDDRTAVTREITPRDTTRDPDDDPLAWGTR